MTALQLIVTQGPYSSFIADVASIKIVSGIRLNTIMPIKEGRIEEKLQELRSTIAPKTLWIDLKARQLRVREFANTPYTAVTISHKISVNLPTIVYFDNGNITGKLVDIDGHKLILEDYVGRLLGPGESVNIVDDSLKYLEPERLTDNDLRYVELCRKLGIRYFMLSFVESKADVEHLKNLYPGCVVMAKIESKKGLDRLEDITPVADLIMAARGDLYTELDYPHQIADALKRIYRIAGDKSIVASRMLESLLKRPVPSCPDIMDLQFLKEIGYTKFLIGDDICFKKDLLMRAIKIFTAIFA
jgi:pyruvate kinase